MLVDGTAAAAAAACGTVPVLFAAATTGAATDAIEPTKLVLKFAVVLGPADVGPDPTSETFAI